jgi:hypothetical protein
VPEGALDSLRADGHAPLEIRTNPMLGTYAATVCAIVHDEMFFLEAFLAHYRRLGADRFIILDDCSTDGTLEFLAAQPDVMVVGSGLRYFAEVSYPPDVLARIRETRAVRLWRDQMLDQFCAGQWAVVVDPDEFLALPGDLPTLFASLAAEGAEAAWGVMVDMYPERVRDILGKDTARFRLEDDWFFDAKPHLDPKQPRETPPVPRTVYPGSVSRLFATWGVLPQGTLVRRVRRRISGYRYQGASPIHKTPVIFWKAGDWFLNCHVTSKPVAPRVIPIMHFKFTTDLGRKIEYALETGGYNQGSRSYRLYATLIERMRARDGAFVAKVSRRYRGPGDFAEAGIAR